MPFMQQKIKQRSDATAFFWKFRYAEEIFCHRDYIFFIILYCVVHYCYLYIIIFYVYSIDTVNWVKSI